MTKPDTKEIRKKYSSHLISEDPYPIAVDHPDVLALCDAHDEAQKEIERLQTDLFAHATKSDKRIAELEKLVNYLLPKAEYANDGNCPECDAYHLQPHGADCEFIKARAVLEGK